MLSSRLGSTYCSLPLATLHQTPNNSGYNSLSKLSLVSTSEKKKKILFLWFQLKDIVFKCSHARGNPTAVTGTECQIKLHYLWNQVVSILNGPWKSTWLEHNCPKAVYTSLFCPCSTVRQLLTSHDNAALSLRQWKILRRKQGSFTSGRKSWEAALGTAWALWVGGKQNRSTSLLPGHSLLGRLSPTRKWINGRKIEVLITTSEARGDKISLLLQLSSCHFPFYVLLTLRALFFFFVMYRVCDYPLLKG